MDKSAKLGKNLILIAGVVCLTLQAAFLIWRLTNPNIDFNKNYHLFIMIILFGYSFFEMYRGKNWAIWLSFALMLAAIYSQFSYNLSICVGYLVTLILIMSPEIKTYQKHIKNKQS